MIYSGKESKFEFIGSQQGSKPNNLTSAQFMNEVVTLEQVSVGYRTSTVIRECFVDKIINDENFLREYY